MTDTRSFKVDVETGKTTVPSNTAREKINAGAYQKALKYQNIQHSSSIDRRELVNRAKKKGAHTLIKEADNLFDKICANAAKVQTTGKASSSGLTELLQKIDLFYWAANEGSTDLTEGASILEKRVALHHQSRLFQVVLPCGEYGFATPLSLFVKMEGYLEDASEILTQYRIHPDSDKMEHCLHDLTTIKDAALVDKILSLLTADEKRDYYRIKSQQDMQQQLHPKVQELIHELNQYCEITNVGYGKLKLRKKMHGSRVETIITEQQHDPDFQKSLQQYLAQCDNSEHRAFIGRLFKPTASAAVAAIAAPVSAAASSADDNGKQKRKKLRQKFKAFIAKPLTDDQSSSTIDRYQELLKLAAALNIADEFNNKIKAEAPQLSKLLFEDSTTVAMVAADNPHRLMPASSGSSANSSSTQPDECSGASASTQKSAVT